MRIGRKLRAVVRALGWWAGFLLLIAATARGELLMRITAANVATDLGNFTCCAWGDVENDGHLPCAVRP